MATADIYRRIFTRNRDPDVDVIADQDFRQANFKDFFGGKWLSQPDNVNKTTFHEVLTDFYGKTVNALKNT
jgi:hypothetical protein